MDGSGRGQQHAGGGVTALESGGDRPEDRGRGQRAGVQILIHQQQAGAGNPGSSAEPRPAPRRTSGRAVPGKHRLCDTAAGPQDQKDRGELPRERHPFERQMKGDAPTKRSVRRRAWPGTGGGRNRHRAGNSEGSRSRGGWRRGVKAVVFKAGVIALNQHRESREQSVDARVLKTGSGWRGA